MSVATQELAGVYVADKQHSSITFGVKHMGVSVFRAGFTDVDARLVADGSETVLAGEASVESASITSPDFRDHVVYGDDFLAARDHPAIGFLSNRFEIDGDEAVRVEGELTIKGISKTIEARGRYQPPVQDPFGGVRAALELQATIDRRDFGISWQMPLPDGGDSLGYDVELAVHLELKKEA